MVAEELPGWVVVSTFVLTVAPADIRGKVDYSFRVDVRDEATPMVAAGTFNPVCGHLIGLQSESVFLIHGVLFFSV
jgi:hypothetical protein